MRLQASNHCASLGKGKEGDFLATGTIPRVNKSILLLCGDLYQSQWILSNWPFSPFSWAKEFCSFWGNQSLSTQCWKFLDEELACLESAATCGATRQTSDNPNLLPSPPTHTVHTQMLGALSEHPQSTPDPHSSKGIAVFQRTHLTPWQRLSSLYKEIYL